MVILWITHVNIVPIKIKGALWTLKIVTVQHAQNIVVNAKNGSIKIGNRINWKRIR
jgi:hypothetical protein